MDTRAKLPKTNVELNYLKKKNTDEAIHKKLRNKYVYETKIHKIYNIIVGQTSVKLQKKAALNATSQSVKAGQEPIGYLMILKKL